MKVLFLQDVRPTAMAGDVKEVKKGFARNFLMPQGLAVLATREELKRAEGLRKAAEQRRLAETAEWHEVADKVKDQQVTITVRSGPTGRLYGSVTNTMIAEALSEAVGRELDRRWIRIPSPIRTTGVYAVPIRYGGAVDAEVNVLVRSDEDRGPAAQVEEPTFDEAIAAVEEEEAEAAEEAEESEEDAEERG